MGTPNRRVRLCIKDLYQQDLIEMIDRETRQFELWEILDPDDPHFHTAYQMLWEAFGPHGEMEREEAIKRFLTEDAFEPTASGTYVRYFLLAARDVHGNLRGVRDGSILINPGYAPNLCVVYLSHIFMVPEARGTVLSYWLRIAPVELAVQYLQDLHTRGKIKLPAPEMVHKYFGMQLDLTAEMEYFTPEERISWQRILFYGRGGFDVINPRSFPYQQPDFREPEEIRQTGNRPQPYMMLVRRLGRERQATMGIEEASALMRLMYDDFACHCAPEFLANSLQVVLDRLQERAKQKTFVELLPLPTSSKDLNRLKRLFRPNVFQRYYKGLSPFVDAYLAGGIKQKIAENPKYLDDSLAQIAKELDARPKFVYGSRSKDFTWDGQPVQPVVEPEPEPELPP